MHQRPVTLPVTLWFLDKGKTQRADTVLFMDARHIYRQVDRAHRNWTPAQIGFMANLVRLYRGEALDVTFGGEEAAAKIKKCLGSSLFMVTWLGFAKWLRCQRSRRRVGH